MVDEIIIGGLGAKYPESKEMWKGTWAAMCKRDNKGKKIFAGTAFLNEVWADIWTMEDTIKMFGAFRACPEDTIKMLGSFRASLRAP
jgi:hypothetical protein